MTTVTSAPTLQRALPWVIRLGVAAACVAVPVARSVGTNGLDNGRGWGLGVPMAVAFMVGGLVVAFPFAVVEGFFARRGSLLWVQCITAAAGGAVIGWFAGLPVVLLSFADWDPTRQEYIENAVRSFLVMAAVHSLLMLRLRSRAARTRSADDHRVRTHG